VHTHAHTHTHCAREEGRYLYKTKLARIFFTTLFGNDAKQTKPRNQNPLEMTSHSNEKGKRKKRGKKRTELS